MTDEIPTPDEDQDSDYDGAWKEAVRALRRFLRAFLAKYFPQVYAAIDWTCELEWCDKELSQVIGQSGKRNRRVDVLVKVRLLTGEDQRILVHVEIQSSYEAGFDLPLYEVRQDGDAELLHAVAIDGGCPHAPQQKRAQPSLHEQMPARHDHRHGSRLLAQRADHQRIARPAMIGRQQNPVAGGPVNRGRWPLPDQRTPR
jgi:hypothetical protein